MISGIPRWGNAYDNTPPIAVQAVWNCLIRSPWWLPLPAHMQTFRNLFEAEPITFYQWPETDAGKPIEQPIHINERKSQAARERAEPVLSKPDAQVLADLKLVM